MKQQWIVRSIEDLERVLAELQDGPQRWKAQINGQIRTVTAAQDYSRELYDPEAEFWRKADGFC